MNVSLPNLQLEFRTPFYEIEHLVESGEGQGGDRAHDYYLCINPSAREGMSEVHRCEPYVYAQLIAGRDAPAH